MSTRFKLILVLSVTAASLFALIPSYHAYKKGGNPTSQKDKINLGLDLQGGMYLDVEVDTQAAVDHTLDALAVEIEEGLLEKLVNYRRVERKGGAVEVELAQGEPVKWNEAPFDRLKNRAQMDMVSPSLVRFSLSDSDANHIRDFAVSQALEVIRNRIDALGVSEPSIQRAGENSLTIQLPGLKDRASALRTIGTQAVLEFYLVEDGQTQATMDPMQHVLKVHEVVDPNTRLVVDRQPYVLNKRPLMSGEMIREGRVEISPNDNMPYVGISFTSAGKERFAKITEANVGHRLAIVLDEKVQSAPVIREAITGGEAQITGQFSMTEATELAIVLRSGSLPAPIKIREERSVGASLGEDSIRQGLMSAVVGTLLVMGFMVMYYGMAGLFANVALVLNLLVILAALAGLGATLTLPGIAGITLTLGIAVDANVLIYERIREELARTSNIRLSVAEGYHRAFGTILDSHLTTMFAAFALLAFGTGPIKGFAITLAIGISASMFTAIVVSRLLFELVYLNRAKLTKISV